MTVYDVSIKQLFSSYLTSVCCCRWCDYDSSEASCVVQYRYHVVEAGLVLGILSVSDAEKS